MAARPLVYRFAPLATRADFPALVSASDLPPGDWVVLPDGKRFLDCLDFWAGRVALWKVTVEGTGEVGGEETYYSGSAVGYIPQIFTLGAASGGWTPDPLVWRQLLEDGEPDAGLPRAQISDEEFRAIDERAVFEVDRDADYGAPGAGLARAIGFYAPPLAPASSSYGVLSGTLTIHVWDVEEEEFQTEEVDSMSINPAPGALRLDPDTGALFYLPAEDQAETVIGDWTFSPPDGETPRFRVAFEPYRWWPYAKADGSPLYDVTTGGVAS